MANYMGGRLLGAAILAVLVFFGLGTVGWPADRGIAAAASEQKKQPQKICDVSFKAPALVLQGERKFGQARYEVNDKCEPELVLLQYLRSVPTPKVVQKPAKPPSEARARLSRDGHSSTDKTSIQASYTCRVVAWEQEVVDKRMIQIENFTDWTTAAGEIANAHITARSITFFRWWHLISGPFARAWWVVEYTAAHTLGQASFNCDGAPFCPGGPKYPMTLKAHTDIFASGRCEGYAEYDGQLVPGGSFDYSVSR